MNNKSTLIDIEVYDTFENKYTDKQKIISLKLNKTFHGIDYTF